MITQETKDIVNSIRRGEIDINNSSNFFDKLIKGLLINLNKDINIRSKRVPHFILHTGDDTMYLSVKGQDSSIEPKEISNEDYVYSVVPRCIVQPKGVDIQSDQVTSPYSNGILQYERDGSLYTFSGEFRRMPIKMSFDLMYLLDNYTDNLELIQQIISKLVFIQTYKFVYMGQETLASYVVPTSLSEEHLVDMDGQTTDSKLHKINISIDVESTYPVWQPKTIVSTSQWIAKFKQDSYTAPSGGVKQAINNKISVYDGGEGLQIKSKLIK